MRILHVTQGYTPAIGGTELLIQRISEEMIRQYSDQVVVFTTNCYGADAFHSPWLPSMPAGEEFINGVSVRRFKVARWPSLGCHLLNRGIRLTGLPLPERMRVCAEGPLIPNLKQIISREPGELIAASSFPLKHMFDAVEAAQLSKRPCVLHGGIHPEDSWGFNRKMIYRAVQAATYYIANTQYEADYVISRGADPKKVIVIGVGVDPDPFLTARGESIRSQFGIQQYPIIGYIGQFAPHKGVDVLLQAMPGVWKKVPEARLILAGARRKFARRLETIVKQFKKADQAKVICVYDFSPELKPELYSALDVFVYPSLYESFGIAFLEAWAAGKPVVGCRTGAIPWVVDHQKDGLLVEPGNIVDLSDTLVKLIQDPSLAKKLGENGRRKTLSQFTWPDIARRFHDVYQRAMQKV